MSIQEIIINIKQFFEDKDVFLAILLVLVSVASFGLGRASVPNFKPQNSSFVGQQTATSVLPYQTGEIIETQVEKSSIIETTDEATSVVPTEARYVASKNGTKYHLPWCVGAKQIKEENKVWFNSKAEAEKAGFTPAGNCKGI